MKHYRCISTERITLKDRALETIQPIHIELIRQWRNAQIDVLRQSAPISSEEQINYFEKQIWPTLQDERPPQILLSYFEGKKLIGYGGLTHINWDSAQAEISFLLDGSRAVDLPIYRTDFLIYLDLIKMLAFQEIGLHRLYAETFSSRNHHITVLEESGFTPEGIMRDHVRIDGQYLDCLVHGMFAND
jgi:RimJ/RimL family protein N-acetyltransferase